MDHDSHPCPLPLSGEAALIAALASTAIPFAHSEADQAERWLRVLRMHGHVGRALQALGVGERPLTTDAQPAADVPADLPEADQVVGRVIAEACGFASARASDSVGTLDILFALFAVYDRLIDRALYIRGTSRDELIERLVEHADAAAGVVSER